VRTSTAESNSNPDQLHTGTVVDDLKLLRAGREAEALAGSVHESPPPRLVEAREIGQRERNYRWMLAVADALAALIATGLAVWAWNAHMSWPYLLAPVYAVATAKLQGLYDRDEMALHKTTMDEWRRRLQPAALLTLGV